MNPFQQASDPSASGSASHGPLTQSFFKTFGMDRKLRVDGQPSKRRGPKPDSKPAQTRRQELNRQAQRTHRERKEMYVKLLEAQLDSSRANYAQVAQELDTSRQEVQRLRDMLASHGIAFFPSAGTLSPHSPTYAASSHHAMTADSVQRFPKGPSSSSGSPPGASSSEQHTPYSQHQQFQISPPHSQTQLSPHNQQFVPSMPLQPPPPPPQQQQQQQQQQPQPIIPELLMSRDIDYTQFAKDFIKSLELPCSGHQQMLCERAVDVEADASGHALMATCPPRTHVEEFPGTPYPHQLPQMPDRELIRLFSLSQGLSDAMLEHGEVSPIDAWRIIWSCRELAEMSLNDLFTVQDFLMPKVRCYGYGAVLEKFEVLDAIEHALSFKDSTPTGAPLSTVMEQNEGQPSMVRV